MRSEGRALKGWKRQFREGAWVCGYDSVGRKAQKLWVIDVGIRFRGKARGKKTY